MHIYLMGYRGSGKSTVGRRLADRLGLPVVDTDTVIEAAAGQSIREIFAGEGEDGFRQREQLALEQVAEKAAPCVIALGGGAILRGANQRTIQRTGKVVWLTGSPSALLARIQADTTTAQRRPALSSSSDYDEIVGILAARSPIYQRLANLTVDTDGRAPEEIVADIADWLKTNA